MIKEVVDQDSYAIVKALNTMKDRPKNFSNMPRNVFMGGSYNQNIDKFVLKEKGYWDMAPALFLYLSEHYANHVFHVVADPMFDDEVNRQFLYAYVFDGDEAVGTITADGNALKFTNNRIKQALVRGTAKKTTKFNTAKSIFATYFYGMTTAEHMDSLAGEVGSEVFAAKLSMRNEWLDADRKLLKFLSAEVDKNNQSIMTCIETLGGAHLTDAYRATKEAAEAVKNLETLVKGDKGYYVMFKDDEYITWRKNACIPERLKRENMPESMRMALGLLKLAEVKTFVHEAGFKVAENKFFILDEVQLGLDD